MLLVGVLRSPSVEWEKGRSASLAECSQDARIVADCLTDSHPFFSVETHQQPYWWSNANHPGAPYRTTGPCCARDAANTDDCSGGETARRAIKTGQRIAGGTCCLPCSGRAALSFSGRRRHIRRAVLVGYGEGDGYQFVGAVKRACQNFVNGGRIAFESYARDGIGLRAQKLRAGEGKVMAGEKLGKGHRLFDVPFIPELSQIF